jgi:hypothetical protein
MRSARRVTRSSRSSPVRRGGYALTGLLSVNVDLTIDPPEGGTRYAITATAIATAITAGPPASITPTTTISLDDRPQHKTDRHEWCPARNATLGVRLLP